MTSTTSVVAEIENAVSGGSPEKRVETLRRVTDLFLNDSDRFNEEQIGVFDDVLVHLIQRIESKALVEFSTSLAPIENAPIEVVRRLARDNDVTVAGPVLTKSNRLTESDLVEIAETKGQQHLLAISGRSNLAESVTDVLVERGDSGVTHRLANNSGAQFSKTGYSTLVKKAESDGGLAEKLGQRLDIPSNLLNELLSRATDTVRSRLLASAPPQAREKLQQALAGIAKQIGVEAAGPRDFKASENLVRELNRNGKLNESVLFGFAQGRQFEEMASALALFCQSRVEVIEALMKKSSVDGLLVACKAANLSWPTVTVILNARISHHSISTKELGDAQKAFYALSQAAAQRTMRFMAIKATVKKAG